jgi:hypothetical protein
MGCITSATFERIDDVAFRRSSWKVDFGERFAMIIEFELDRYVPDLVVGIGFRNDRGEDVLTSHSIDTPAASLSEGKTRGTGRVTVSHPWLRPGTYYLEAALISGAQLVDYVADAATLSVEEQSAPHSPPLALKKGMVAPVWEWRIE